jgi:hypothetical protein
VCATSTDVNTDVPISFEYHPIRPGPMMVERDTKMGHGSHSALLRYSGSMSLCEFEFQEVKRDASEGGYDFGSGVLCF